MLGVSFSFFLLQVSTKKPMALAVIILFIIFFQYLQWKVRLRFMNSIVYIFFSLEKQSNPWGITTPSICIKS